MAVSLALVARLLGNGTNPGRRGASPKGARRVECCGAAIPHPKVLPSRLAAVPGVRPQLSARAAASVRLAALSLPRMWVTCC